MSINVYAKGQLIRLTGTFYDVDETLSDPTDVTLYVMAPDGSTDTFTYVGSPTEVTRESTGTYYYDLSASATGQWHYRWEGSGTITSASQGEFFVQPRVIT